MGSSVHGLSLLPFRRLDMPRILLKRLKTIPIGQHRFNVEPTLCAQWNKSLFINIQRGDSFICSEVQSTLVISKSRGPSKTLRDIRTSTYQICSIEQKVIRTTKFHKRLCDLTPLVRNIY